MNPSAVCVLLCANNTSSAVGADVQFNSASDFIGALALVAVIFERSFHTAQRILLFHRGIDSNILNNS